MASFHMACGSGCDAAYSLQLSHIFSAGQAALPISQIGQLHVQTSQMAKRWVTTGASADKARQGSLSPPDSIPTK